MFEITIRVKAENELSFIDALHDLIGYHFTFKEMINESGMDITLINQDVGYEIETILPAFDEDQ